MEHVHTNVHKITWENKEIILVATAHISRHSVQEVQQVIETEQPDAVCVELDQSRYQALVAGDQWQQMDIFKSCCSLTTRQYAHNNLLGLFFEMLQIIVMTEIQSLIALLFFCFGI
ncbi:hypothetical protein GCM10010965_00310 [Caldalkalibacillus thermarum]|uniref:TraB/GumN family protein n=1 Tax=Caldalkalibacillus thermarum TaxID=296745 RepID=UPI001667FED7|nr:TraB domain-containing protein [Caldalkalibacillus thermarum]GGK11370.1 hypothetical protein GCM10010965_00310 [Caldalkalibacillus thermarum]